MVAAVLVLVAAMTTTDPLSQSTSTAADRRPLTTGWGNRLPAFQTPLFLA